MSKFHPLTVAKVKHETRDAIAVTFDVPPQLQDTFRYRQGQHLTLRARGVADLRIVTRLSPAWTTDWMSDAGKAALKGYGIAPPVQQVIDISALSRGVKRHAIEQPDVACPHCGSPHTRLTSQFGSTPCKALYQCLDCREPFDYFKCH